MAKLANLIKNFSFDEHLSFNKIAIRNWFIVWRSKYRTWERVPSKCDCASYLDDEWRPSRPRRAAWLAARLRRLPD